MDKIEKIYGSQPTEWPTDTLAKFKASLHIMQNGYAKWDIASYSDAHQSNLRCPFCSPILLILAFRQFAGSAGLCSDFPSISRYWPSSLESSPNTPDALSVRTLGFPSGVGMVRVPLQVWLAES